MQTRSDQEWVKHWDFILVDILCLQLALAMVSLLRQDVIYPYNNAHLLHLYLVVSFCQIAAMMFSASYFNIVRRTVIQELWCVFKFAVMTALLTLLYFFVTKTTDTASRLQIGTSMIFFVILDTIGRTLNKSRIFAANKEHKRTIVLITSTASLRKTYENIYTDTTVRNFTLAQAFTLDEVDPTQFADLPVTVSHLDDHAIDVINHMYVDEVLVVQPDDMPMPKKAIDIFMNMGITVNYTNSFMENFTEIHRIGYLDILTSSVKFVSPFDLSIKRLFDIFGGLVGCFFTCILYIFIAPAIKIKSPGPVFFKQDRIGRNGKVFKMYKFRSMYLDAEQRKAELESMNKASSDLIFKIDDDPRIIGSEKKDKNGKPKGIGNFLRKTSLDEFPQFFNVLKGDMSLVGTRPPTKDEWSKYSLTHRIRMSTRPGITGMWQVSGRSKITDFEKIVALDRYYIEHWSLGLDLSILFKTVLVMLKHDGAV